LLQVWGSRGRRRCWWWWWKMVVVLVITNSNTKTNKLYLLVKPRVYPDPCSRVGVYVGSDIPYPDPDPPNPYPRTPGVSETLAQHYPWEWKLQKSWIWNIHISAT
jgi:hypothetical protein